MNRRAFLAGVGSTGAGLLAGCFGGGEVVVDVQRTPRIEPGSGWTKEIPDVSDPGGAISYSVEAKRPFDVYVFTDRRAFDAYRSYVTGGDPQRTPPGNDRLSMAAVPRGEAQYVAETAGGGGRESLEASGPSWFVVDHSSYRLEHPVDEYADPLRPSVTLTVVRKRAGL